MLFKNNERFEFTKDQRKEVDKFVEGRYPVRIIFPKSMYIHNPNTENHRRIDRPSMAIIPFEEIVEDEKTGVKVHWRYTKVPPTTLANGAYNFSGCDTALMFDGDKSFGKDDMELLYFLLFISRGGTHQKNSQRHTFEVVNKAASAKKMVETEGLRADVMAAIVGRNCIIKSDVIRVSRAFNLTLTADMTESEMRAELLTAVNGREQLEGDGYSLFLELISNDERTEIINMIGKAKQLNIIKFFSAIQSWVELDSNGKKVRDICKVPKGKDPDAHLEFTALNDEDVSEALKASLQDRELILETATEE